VEDKSLYVFDLSRIPASRNLKGVLRAILQHEAWETCEGCELASANGDDWCPVFENLQRLRKPTIQNRLTKLATICEYINEHLTMRHLLMMVANALVGHAEAKGPVKAVVCCAEVPRLSKAPTSAAYFQNIFGANLPRSLKTPPFSILSSLGVGTETNNRIDHLLVYGDLDESRSEDYWLILQHDTRYGLTQSFIQQRQAYREGHEEEAESPFMAALTAQRRRLYFEMPEELEARYRHQDLTVFRSADEYRQQILERLNRDQRVSETVLNRLVIVTSGSPKRS